MILLYLVQDTESKLEDVGVACVKRVEGPLSGCWHWH